MPERKIIPGSYHVLQSQTNSVGSLTVGLGQDHTVRPADVPCVEQRTLAARISILFANSWRPPRPVVTRHPSTAPIGASNSCDGPDVEEGRLLSSPGTHPAAQSLTTSPRADAEFHVGVRTLQILLWLARCLVMWSATMRCVVSSTQPCADQSRESRGVES